MRLRERFHRPPRLLIVTAVEAERAAVLRGLGRPDAPPPVECITAGDPIVVQAGGVGCAAAAAETARSLTLAEARGDPFQVVVCAGVAGGFAGRAAPCATVIGTASVAVDLGADSPDGFIPLHELGFGATVRTADADVVAVLRAALPDAATGEVLTVSTVTGTAERAAELIRRHPDAVAEAMEGFGVATAADLCGVAFAELRTVSNPVGPRDRASWRIPDALAALQSVSGVLAAGIGL